MVKNPFKLEKLKIKVFSKRRRKSGDYIDTFEVMFNPESYSLEYENRYDARQGLNTSAAELKYQISKPSDLKLQLVIDGTDATSHGGKIPPTGAIKGIKKSILEQVNKFRELTLKMGGKEHEPHYLIVHWSHLYFKCRLKSVNIKYTLFNRSGEPIRAELDTHFVRDLDEAERIRLEKKSSPDLTHVRVVKAGDTLPLMAQEIYGDASYYIQVARINHLNTVRALKAGTSLRFPPIKK